MWPRSRPTPTRRGNSRPPTSWNTDDNTIIVPEVTHRRLKFLPPNYVPTTYASITNLWDINYWETGQAQAGQIYQHDNYFSKGDFVTFCLDVGRVSQNMLNVQAQQIWQFAQTVNTNVPSTVNPDIYEGTTLYLMGMSYLNYCDRFTALNNNLHKVTLESSFQYGFALLYPQLDGGYLPSNGVINLITPAVSFDDNGQVFVFNGSLNANSGPDYESSIWNYYLQGIVQGSAAEHGVLRDFFQTNAISTVKLLQQAGTNTVTLNISNYLAMGTKVYNGVQLQNADTNIWFSLTNTFASGNYEQVAFITPGIMTNGSYVGVGMLLLSPGLYIAAVGGLNGGFADDFSTTTFSYDNAPNLTLVGAPDDSVSPFFLQTSSPVGNPVTPVDGATTADLLAAVAANLGIGTQFVDPNLQQAAANESILLGIPNTVAAGFQASCLNMGTLSSTIPFYSDAQQFAGEPVNVMSGEFYIDAVDLSLPGPLNLQVRRNYSSQNQVENEFGFGWKMNYMPFLSLATNSILIYAAEMDGTVVAYRQTGTNANVWLPIPSGQSHARQ